MSSSLWVPIIYRDFYDVPRIFAFEHGRGVILCDCRFDPAEDEYSSHYVIRRLQIRHVDQLPAAWIDLNLAGVDIGEIPVDRVRFDETRRQSVDVGSFEEAGIHLDE